MKIERKLAEWREAGLLDAETAARILAHEAAEKRPYLLYAVSGLGALSIAIGLVSIVASNWDAIGPGVKLGLDFALLLGLAAAIYRAERGGWAAEVLLFVYYGAVLASIGLVGQIYHLGGKVEDALLLWSLVTAPAVLHGSSRFLGATWLLGAESVVLAQVDRGFDTSWRRRESLVALTAAFLLSVGLAALGGWAWFRARKPAFAAVAGILGRVQVVLLATLMPFAWYSRTYYGDHEVSGGLGAICVLGALAASVAVALRDREIEGPARGAVVVAAGLAAVLTLAPFAVEHPEANGFAAAASFLLVWGSFGFAAYRLGRLRLLNLATGLIALRILIVYFEVFGSLLDTGLGLLFGGVITVLLAWIWVKKSRQWARMPAAGGGGDHG